MKLLEGGSLKDCLGRYPNDPRAAARLVAVVARAVSHAHQRGILHRDLKPGNILLDAEGRPYVTDFGLVKRIERDDTLTPSGALLGTPEYMAPEQARAEKRLTTAVDVYSLGALLYALLTGGPPFRGENLLETLRQLQERGPEPPRARNAQVDRDLETICLKCLAKEPEGRYGFAEAVAVDLENWLAGEPIRARPVGRLERAMKWARRRPGVAVLLASVVLALAGGSGFSTYFAIQSGNRAAEAQANARSAQTNEMAAHAARKELEVALANSLFRPLGHKPEPPGPFETEALWELGTLTNDPVRVRFLEKALESGETAARLTYRADLAVHAAVGLDPDRRQQVGQLLLARLDDRGADSRVQLACVHVGVALGEDNPAFRRRGVKTLFAALDRPADPFTLPLQARALRTLADQLDSGQAAKAVRRALGQRARDPESARQLAAAFKTLAGKLDRGQAATFAQAVVADLDRRDAIGEIDYRFSASALLALATRLDRDEASGLIATAAEKVGERMGLWEMDQGLEDDMAWAFRSLTGRLDRSEQARVAAQAIRRVIEQMPQAYHGYIPGLARAFGVLAGLLDRAEADRLAGQAAQVLAERMGRSHWAIEYLCLAEAFQSLAGRLDRDLARRLAGQAARAVAGRMGGTTELHEDVPLPDYQQVVGLARAFAALAGLLDRGEADRLAGPAALAVAERLARTNNLNEQNSLVMAFQALVSSLDRDHAGQVARRPAQVIVERMSKSTTSYELKQMALSFEALARGLDRDQAGRLAAQAARAVKEQLGRSAADGPLDDLVEAFRALAGRLERGEARRLAGQLAQALTERLSRATRPPSQGGVYALVRPCGALADSLDGEQAGKLASQILKTVLRVDERLPTEPPEQHDAFARRMTAAAVKALAGNLDPGRTAEVAALVAEQMAQTASVKYNHPVDDFEALTARLDRQQLADLLKNPFCVGPARDIVLQQLGRQVNRQFASVWDFVAWAQQHEPGLDLRTPPRRVER
jgi:hypothetical protein